MTIEISDNREQWLIGLGKKYAAAVARENDARAAYDTAVKERIRLGEEIARIGGYINEVKHQEAENEHSEPIRRRDCQNWSGDHCAKTKGIDCRRDCVEYRRY